MKRVMLVLCLALLLVLPGISSALEVKKVDNGSVVIAELDNPAVFQFYITNPSQPEEAEIFSLVGVSFSPRGMFELQTGTTSMEVRAYPNKQIRRIPGPYVFEYQIRGQNSGLFKDTLTLQIVPLAETLVLEDSSFKPGETSVKLTVRNTQNTHIENVQIALRSEFFETSKTLSFKPYESKSINIPIDTIKAARLHAGRYIVTAEITLENAKTRIDGVIHYLDQQGTSIETSSEGFLVKQTTTTKKNQGNVALLDSIVMKRDILTRLFTSYSREPASVDRNGIFVTYTWEQNLEPGESWSVIATTNYTFPFLVLLFIIAVALVVQQYSRSHINVKKEVSYVKTKGGEFALKVRVSVKAREHVENVQLIDRLPGMTKLYEKFGTKPDKMDAGTRRIFWNIDRLQAGEERVFSYIIYSTVRVVGRYELPAATAVYERDGKVHEGLSNRAFFMSDSGKVNQE